MTLHVSTASAENVIESYQPGKSHGQITIQLGGEPDDVATHYSAENALYALNLALANMQGHSIGPITLVYTSEPLRLVLSQPQQDSVWGQLGLS